VTLGTRPTPASQFGLVFWRTHIGPDQPPVLASGIRPGCALYFRIGILRFIRHVHADAVHVVFSSRDIHTSSHTLRFVPKKGWPPVRTGLFKQPYVTVRVAERYQVFPEQLDPTGGQSGSVPPTATKQAAKIGEVMPRGSPRPV